MRTATDAASPSTALMSFKTTASLTGGIGTSIGPRILADEATPRGPDGVNARTLESD
jgi:hypothetical protein